MKYATVILCGALTVLVHDAASAASARFGCEARAPKVCHFHIFYQRGGRDVVLPAGVKQAIPDVRIGKDTYCVAVDQKPRRGKCDRKIINATYNN